MGTSLGKYFSEGGLNVKGYYSRSAGSAQDAARFTATEAFDDMEALVKECDVIFLTVPDGSKPEIIVRAYNLFDLFTESNRYESPEFFVYQIETSEEEVPESLDEKISSEYTGVEPEPAKPALAEEPEVQREPGFLTFLEICLVVVIVLFVILLISQMVSYHTRQMQRRQRRKDDGDKRNQQR